MKRIGAFKDQGVELQEMGKVLNEYFSQGEMLMESRNSGKRTLIS